MTDELKYKVERSIRLLQAVAKTNTDIELCYSGGKDSDVILELAKMAGIPFTPIYKNTTIDPPGTIGHVRENGVQIVQPKRSFFKIIEAKGFPSRFARFCCSEIKEYKIKDTAILGIRKAESSKRDAIYTKPVMCRLYDNKEENHVNQILPILDWTLEDVQGFILEHNIKLAPYYYKTDGTVDLSRRLGCLGCPLQADRGKSDFINHPKLVRAWIKAGKIWWDKPRKKELAAHSWFSDIYECFMARIFYDTVPDMCLNRESLFTTNWKHLLAGYYKIDLP